MPASDDIGSKSVTVRVEDGRGGISEQRYVLSVIDAPPNRPPVFASVPPVDASVGASYRYHAIASDADGDPLNYSVIAGPAGFVMDANTGHVAWSPTAEDLGQHAVSLRVSDNAGGAAAQDFVIRVEQQLGNHSPTIISQPNSNAIAMRVDANWVDQFGSSDDEAVSGIVTIGSDLIEVGYTTGQLPGQISAQDQQARNGSMDATIRHIWLR